MSLKAGFSWQNSRSLWLSFLLIQHGGDDDVDCHPRWLSDRVRKLSVSRNQTFVTVVGRGGGGEKEGAFQKTTK